MVFLKIYKYYSIFRNMRKLFHNFSVNNTKRNINITKLNYIDKLCIICYNNYTEFMFEDNQDYIEIV